MRVTFNKYLYKWYDQNIRLHPWLGSKNAYLIWLSEIIMQQTRIEQGTSYFLKFAKKYPTVKHLAKAKEDEVLKLWEGLGYYSRARNLLQTAKEIVEVNHGNFPQTYNELIKLKGIGPYTASAILSFAFGKPYAVMDGNVLRILSRIFGIREPIDTTEGKKKFSALAERLIDRKDPGKYNQAIMDFGALICTPAAPRCGECPFRKTCYAFQNDLVELLPVKSKKAEKKKRYFNYLIFTDGKQTLIEKRTRKDIWLNLYQFPMIESTKKMNRSLLIKSKQFRDIISNRKTDIISHRQFTQELTHQFIKADFFMIRIDALQRLKAGETITVSRSALKKYAFPGVIREYLQEIPTFRS